MKKNLNYLLGLALCAFTLTGCTEKIEPGFVGMKIARDGVVEEVLETGRHDIWGFDRLVQFELSESINTETLDILCKDDLKFGFDLKVRSRLRQGNAKAMANLLNIQGSKIEWNGDTGKLSRKFLYVTYVQPAARVVARNIVSQYKTTEISANRAKIQIAIDKMLGEKLAGTPMEVTMAEPSNFQYPSVITDAITKARAREMQIQEETAKQAMAMLKETNEQAIELLDAKNQQAINVLDATNRLKIAQKMKAVRATEASAEAAYNKILGASLSSAYLKLRQIDAQTVLYKQIGQGATVIMGGNAPMLTMPMKR